MALIEGIKILCDCGNTHFLEPDDYYIALDGECMCCPAEYATLSYKCPVTRKEVEIERV